MSSASSLITSICATIDLLAELPLRVYDIGIQRNYAEDHIKIKLAKHGMHFDIVGQFYPRVKIRTLHLSSSTGEAHWAITKAPETFTCLAIPAHFTLSYDENREPVWDPVNILFKTAPSKESVRQLDKSIVEVAERLMTRLSRVDML